MDVVLLKVRSHAWHIVKLSGSFFSRIQWPGPWPVCLRREAEKYVWMVCGGVGLSISRFLKGYLVGPENQHRVTCYVSFYLL